MSADLLPALDDVKVFLLEPLIDLRREYRSALNFEGIRHVIDFDTVPDLIAMMRDFMPDILVADMDFAEDSAAPGELSRFIRQARQCQTAIDPFFPVIFMSWRTQMQVLQPMVLAGVDDILAKPVSTGLVVERVFHQIHKRKRFVVTSDYIGPDRRQDGRAKAEDNMLVVPNRLALTAQGVFDEAMYARDVQETREQVMYLRIQSYGQRAHLLARLVQPAMSEGGQDDHAKAVQYLAEIIKIMERMLEEVHLTKLAHTRTLSGQLLEVAQRLFAEQQRMAPKNIKLLIPLAQAVHRAVIPNLDEAALAHDIAQRVENYKKVR